MLNTVHAGGELGWKSLRDSAIDPPEGSIALSSLIPVRQVRCDLTVENRNHAESIFEVSIRHPGFE